MMKITKSLTLLTAVLLSAGQLFAEELPLIRKAPSVPFNAKGEDVKGVMRTHADRIGGFVDPHKGQVELCPSMAQMLYDDDNLYISLQGKFRPEFRSDRTVKRDLFSDNNFEIFLKAEKSDQYCHLAVSEGGLLHARIGKTSQELPGVRHYVFTEKDCWRANLIIPLKSIGLKAEDQKIRFDVCRYNIDMPKKAEQMSSFAVRVGWPNYHESGFWATAEMTSAPGKPKAVWPDLKGKRINLIPDPGFDFTTRKFTSPDVQRQETQLLTNIWIIRATGKVYHFWRFAPRIPMKPGQEYTLKIRARRIGSEGALGCLQLIREGKQVKQGPMPFWNVSLTPEFQEYYFAFKATEKNFIQFVLYRLGKRGNDTGVEVENISLYEGRISSSLDIREVSRVGMKNIIPGTEVRMPDNPYGQSAKPLKVLAIGRELVGLADAAELCAGLNVSVDLLMAKSKKSDTYTTPGDRKRILSRLEKERRPRELILLEMICDSHIDRQKTCVYVIFIS